MDLVDALKGSLHLEHVHWMITIDTPNITLDELEEKVLTMGQHLDQVLSKVFSSHSSAFMLVNSKDTDIKLDNVTKQLSHLSAALLSSRTGPSNRNAGEGRGRGSGQNAGGHGRKKTARIVGEIIIFFTVLELYWRRRKRKMIKSHWMMKVHFSYTLLVLHYLTLSLHLKTCIF